MAADWRWTTRVCLLLLLSLTALAGAGEEIGQIKTLTGEVYIVRQGVKHPAKAGDRLESADSIITGANGRVGITFIDNSRFSAGPESHIELERFEFNPTTHEGAFATKLQRGTLAIISGHIAARSPEAMTVRTPITILGERGTKVLVKVSH
jgi:hypothetical protein